MKFKTILFFVITFMFSIFIHQDVYAFVDEEMKIICPNQQIIKMDDDDVFRQTFLSKVDRFSYVFVKFSNFNTVSDDTVIFRIKELNSDNWYSSGEYRFDKFKNDNFFSFSFIPIINAEGKHFVFELQIKSGKDKVPLGIYLSEGECREDAESYLNKHNMNSDIIFNVGIAESAKQRFFDDLIYRVSNDYPFFSFWFVIVLSAIVIFFKIDL